MAAHEKYQQHLLEILQRYILKSTLYVSEANCFLLQVKLLISTEESSSISNLVCCFEHTGDEGISSCKCF